MRKVKFLVASLLFCAMSYVGYTTYEKMSMTEAEKLMLANVEALTSGESGGGTGSCGSYGWTGDSYFIVCNVSKEEALENFNWWNTSDKGWCCESCSSTWYCGK